jgi:antitoxin VapB
MVNAPPGVSIRHRPAARKRKLQSAPWIRGSPHPLSPRNIVQRVPGEVLDHPDPGILRGGVTERRRGYIFSRIYQQPDTKASMMTTAKVFQSGRSQAVRLPKRFRFRSREVDVQATPDGLLLTEKGPWELFAEGVDAMDSGSGRASPSSMPSALWEASPAWPNPVAE